MYPPPDATDARFFCYHAPQERIRELQAPGPALVLRTNPLTKAPMTATSRPEPADCPHKLVLASSSPFRRSLLERLGLGFETESPEIDETPGIGEAPEALVTRLAEAKARAVGSVHPHALVIGSDQVACIDQRILGKPGNRDNAIKQLRLASGRRVTFFTGLCLYNTGLDRHHIACEPYHVHFRELSLSQIENYVDRERPFGCAGSFRSEALGIALFERLEGEDPNALVGLPLIRLIGMLESEGCRLI